MPPLVRFDPSSPEAPASARALEPFVHEHAVRAYLDLYARALTNGDAGGIAALWDVPALVISDELVLAMARREDVERFVATTHEEHASRGVVDTRPDLQRLEWLTDRIVVADVRWPLFDASHREVGAVRSVYTLVCDRARALKVRALVTRADPAAADAH